MLAIQHGISASGQGSSICIEITAEYLQNLRMSNLEGRRKAIMPYFSMKCIAISPYALPATTTLAPLQHKHTGFNQNISLCKPYASETCFVAMILFLRSQSSLCHVQVSDRVCFAAASAAMVDEHANHAEHD